MVIKKMKSNQTKIEAFKFTLISISAGLIQLLSFALLTWAIPIFGGEYGINYVISLLLSIVWNFTINRKVTFKPTKPIALAMLLILGFYAVFTPVTAVIGSYFVKRGAFELLVLGITMVSNLVLEFVYIKYVVYPEKKKMLIFVGASASGKTELAKYMIKNYGYKKVITTTTRTIRVNEVDGVDYHFVSKDSFKKLLKDGKMIENSEYQNNYYGIQRKDVIKNGIIVMEPKGANFIINNKDMDTFIVYIESSEKIRFERMINRKDSIEGANLRLNQDREIFAEENLSKIDLKLINENNSIEELAKEIDLAYNKSIN